jgi:hypothetical protein
MNTNRVEMSGWSERFISATYTEEDIDESIEVFTKSIELLKPILEFQLTQYRCRKKIVLIDKAYPNTSMCHTEVIFSFMFTD